MRSPSLVKYISGLTVGDYATVTPEPPGPQNQPKIHEDPAVTLLAVDPVLGRTRLTWLGTGPTEATSASVKAELEKLAQLSSIAGDDRIVRRPGRCARR